MGRGVGPAGMADKAKRNPCLTCCVVCTIVVLIIIIVCLIFALCMAWYLGGLVHWGANIKVNEQNTNNYCWGPTFTMEKITNANKKCELTDWEWNEFALHPKFEAKETTKKWMENKKDDWENVECWLNEIGWTKEGGWEPMIDTITADLPKLAIANDLTTTVADCKKESDDGDDDTKFLRCIFFYFEMACRRTTNSKLSLAFLGGADFVTAWGSTVTNVVPDKLAAAPPAPAMVDFKPDFSITPGASVPTEKMMEAPMVYWEADPDALYTLLLVDFDLSGDTRFVHWMVNNIPGNKVKEGDESMDFIKSFAFNYDGTDYITDDETFFHAHGFLIYKQSAEATVADGYKQAGCDDKIGENRLFDASGLALMLDEVNADELVAGNVMKVPYSGPATDAMVCYFTKCTGAAFPAEIAGVNDGAECQASTK